MLAGRSVGRPASPPGHGERATLEATQLLGPWATPEPDVGATGSQGTIATVDGGIGSGPGSSVAQSPYFTVHHRGNGIGGGTGNWLYVADFAKNVTRGVALTPGAETVVPGGGLKGYGPTAGGAARKPLLGTVRRKDGKRQVTYHRWPLYTFAGDSGPGQAHGNGLVSFGGRG